jgi:hypothetical protein
VRTVQSYRSERAAGHQQILKTCQGGPQGEVVQGRNRCNEIEAAIGERRPHHIPFDKGDAVLRLTGSLGTHESAMVDIDANHLFAASGEAPGQ